MRQVACSIVGLGRIASLLEDDPKREKPATHAGAIASNPDCYLLSGCDPDPERRKQFAVRWDCVRVYATFDELVAAHLPDILHVATPPHTHLHYVRKAIEAGIPLVICEKPLAENLKDSGKIVTLASRSKTIVMVNHERRYSEDYLRAKQIVDDEEYGPLISIHGRLYMGFGHRIRDMLLDDGTHLIDIIRLFTGKNVNPLRAFGNISSKGGTLFAYCRSGRIPVTIDAGCDRDYLVFELTLSFPEGQVRIGNGIFEVYESVPSPYYTGFRSLAKKVDIKFEMTGYFSGMLADAVRVLHSPDKTMKPRSTCIDGYEAVRTIHRILGRTKEKPPGNAQS